LNRGWNKTSNIIDDDQIFFTVDKTSLPG